MNTGSAIISIESELAAIVGREYLRESANVLARHAIDGVVPEYVVEPGTEEEVAALVRLANERKLTLYSEGGRTGQVGRTPPRVDIVLVTTRLNTIEHYDPGDLTIGVAAGASVQSVREAVAANNQSMPIEVAYPAQSTIGGVLSRAAHGPLRHGYGPLRDSCLGLRFVTGDSRWAKSGGRVVKNVAGYDLMKLLVGSHGTLAVITAANLKVYPAPRQTRTFVADFAHLNEAIAFRDTVVRSPLTPMCLEIASPLAQEFFSSHSDQQTWRVMVRAGGSDAVMGRYARELGSAVTHVFEAQAEEQYWNSIVEFGDRISSRHQNAMVVALSVAPSELQHAIEVAERFASENNLLVAWSGRCAIAALNLALVPMPQGAPVVTQYSQALNSLRESLAPDAACVVIRCASQVKQHVEVWGATATDIGAMRSVKRALDCNDVLNRGRFIL